MAHKGSYTEKERQVLRRKGVKPGTKKAHKALKRWYVGSDDGMMMK